MKPFDPRVLRLVPAARLPVAALAVVAALSGLAAIGQAFAVSAVVVALVTEVAPQPPPGAASGSAPALTTCLIWAFAAFAARGLLAGATEVVAARTGAIVSGELRTAVLAARLRRGEDDPAATPARLLTLATQGATSIEPYVARYLPVLAAAAVLPPATIVAMAWLDWRTALIPVCTLWLLPLFAALIGMATRDATQRRWRAAAHLAGHFLDVMRGLPTLASYGRARHQVKVIRTVSDEHRVATVATLRTAFLSSAALELLATISVALVAVWVGLALAEGNMALGTALPLILLAPEAYWPIRRVGAEFHNAADGAEALADIAAVLEDDAAEPVAAGAVPAVAGRAAVQPEAGSAAPMRPDAGPGYAWQDSRPAAGGTGAQQGGAPRIRLDGVDYRYGPDLPLVLDGVDAELPVGLSVVTGRSGAGKTTLLELIAGLRRPAAGRIDAPRTHLVTQRPFLAAVSLADNLRLGARPGVTDADLAAALDRVGLTPMLEALPEGLHTVLGDDGFGVSAGQRARIATARALLSDSDVVLLDEPTAHLDPDAEALVHAVIADLATDKVVVAVSHRPGLVAGADRTLVLGEPR